MRKITQATFDNNFIMKYGKSFSVLNNYVNMKTKVIVRCNVCYSEHEIVAENLFRRKHICKNCSSYKQHEVFTKMTKDIPKDFILLNLIRQKRVYKHLICGGEFLMDKTTFAGRCPICDEEAKYLVAHNAISKKFGAFDTSKKIILSDGKILGVDFYIPELDIYIDLYGDYLKFPMGRPNIFITYEQEIKSKQEYCFQNKLKYCIIQDRNDLLDIIIDMAMYFKKHKCTFEHFCRWRRSKGIRKVKRVQEKKG